MRTVTALHPLSGPASDCPPQGSVMCASPLVPALPLRLCRPLCSPHVRLSRALQAFQSPSSSWTLCPHCVLTPAIRSDCTGPRAGVGIQLAMQRAWHGSLIVPPDPANTNPGEQGTDGSGYRASHPSGTPALDSWLRPHCCRCPGWGHAVALRSNRKPRLDSDLCPAPRVAPGATHRSSGATHFLRTYYGVSSSLGRFCWRFEVRGVQRWPRSH